MATKLRTRAEGVGFGIGISLIFVGVIMAFGAAGVAIGSGIMILGLVFVDPPDTKTLKEKSETQG